jgi:hypothetical protein
MFLFSSCITVAAANPDAGAASDSDYSESEEEEKDEEMEERPDDPIAAVRNLFEREEGLAGADNDNVDPPIVIKPALDNRYFTVKGLRKKTGHGTDWSEAGEAGSASISGYLRTLKCSGRPRSLAEPVVERRKMRLSSLVPAMALDWRRY